MVMKRVTGGSWLVGRRKHRELSGTSHQPPTTSHRALAAFTLIELLVVMAIIALLLTIALPRYFHSTDRAREAVLKENLAQMRTAIDQYYADRGSYPERLEDLVEKKYLRSIPPDPITDTTSTWIASRSTDEKATGISDVRSGADGLARDGTKYGDW
jgi:general secretion pathway protein G